MKKLQSLKIFVTLFCAVGLAGAQQNDWLMGHWSGALTESGGGQPAERFIVIKSIQTDGTVTGNWGNVPEKLFPATITLNEGVLTVTTRGSATFVLKRDADRLVGTVSNAAGNTFPVSFTRTPSSVPASEAFSGRASASSACNANFYDVEVTINGNRAAGHWTASRNYYFAGEVVNGEFKAAVLFDATNKVQLTGKRQGDQLEFMGSSSRGCTFSSKLTKK